MIYLILALISWLLYIVLRTKKALHMLQQNNYDKDGRYYRWIIRNKSRVFELIDMFPLMLAILISFINNNLLIVDLMLIMYFIIFIKARQKMSEEATKLPFKLTSRIKRLIVTLLIIYLMPLILINNNYQISMLGNYLYFFILAGYFQYFIVLIAVKINIPIEKLVYYYYFSKAKNKLKMSSNLKVIGITGSYGKTSSKNILNDILSVKYNTLPSPKNFNTPYGLMITVNNYLDKFHDIFIAEMGAYKQGEIKELCDFVNPKYGILTKIGTAHLESFGSQETIINTKFELIESLPMDGIGILNGDDELQRNYKLKNKCKIMWVGIDNKDVDVKASNIKVSNIGTTFNITFKNDKTKYEFETKLLGYANVYNILAAVALGHELGVTIPELQKGVKRVNSIEHRLQMKKYLDINIIDDAYNSNPVGSSMALDVLNTMPGKKIIVTPGMIELGSRQEEFNKAFGNHIAKVCDEVILVGKKQTEPIYEGLMEKKYDKNKIHILNDVKEAFKLMNELKSGDTYVLLENDLPDIFNE